MDSRALVLLAVAAAGGLFLLGFTLYRKRWTPEPDRLDIDALGLELMSGCCAFVVFTTPSCRPCKAAVRVVESAIARNPSPTELRTVDALERPELATLYEVRTIPTVFLITASGHVIGRWRSVPESDDVDAAMALI